MANVIVIANRKGGCGKSFTTANLGVGLARQGKKVLCIDADNQHSFFAASTGNTAATADCFRAGAGKI